MTLSSMTGYARAEGTAGASAWTWELRSVNAKGLEVRFRLPSGWEAVEAQARAMIAQTLQRGTVHATLNVRREGGGQVPRINRAAMSSLLAELREMAGDGAAPRLDNLLSVRGIVDVAEESETPEERASVQAAAVDGLSEALRALHAMRLREGEALHAVLEARLAEIAGLTVRADAAPGRSPEAVKQRLAEQLRALTEATERLDPDRLHQEALLLAMRADIREELDRLVAHVGQARALMAKGGAVGRQLDFLAQELNRESNTLCAKSNDIELTNIGMALKSAVEQFREQVQNLE